MFIGSSVSDDHLKLRLVGYGSVTLDGLVFYHQGDPRGAAVYIGKAESLRGHSVESNYSQLLCVY